MRQAVRSACTGVVLLLCWLSQSVEACTPADILQERTDHVILVGEITDQFGMLYEGEIVLGYLIRPLQFFKQPREELPVALHQVLPSRGMGADCSPSYFTSSLVDVARMIELYPSGRLVAVSGFYRSRSGPGGENAVVGGVEVLPEDCTLQQVADLRPTYHQRSTLCGNSAFHAYKELAGLPSGSIADRREVLARLAGFDMFMNFAALVRTHVDDAEIVEELLAARYAEVIDVGCETRPPQEYEIDLPKDREQLAELRTFRSRWYEYCSVP